MLSQQSLGELGAAARALRGDLGVVGTEAVVDREKLEDVLRALEEVATNLVYDLANLQEGVDEANGDVDGT